METGSLQFRAWPSWLLTCSGCNTYRTTERRTGHFKRREAQLQCPGNLHDHPVRRCSKCQRCVRPDPVRERYQRAMRSMDRVVTRPARVDNVTGRSRQAAGVYPKTGYQVFATSRVLVLSTKVNLWTTHPFLTARCTAPASCDVGHRRLPLPCKLG